MPAHVSHNSGNNEWYTPAPIIEAAREVFGGAIDIDPASNNVAQEIVKARTYYTSETNGLIYPWFGKVWMNPPYAATLIKQFSAKLVSDFEDGWVDEAITLTNNSTETKWFQAIAEISSAVCMPKGRVRFWAPGKLATPLQGQSITYVGKNPDRFVKVFKEIGVVFVKV